MDNLTIVLERAGFGLRDVVSARAFLTQFDEYETFNRVYTEYMGEFLPTRTTIGVVALAAGARSRWTSSPIALTLSDRRFPRSSRRAPCR
jgi:enamine deaminase RidA (YjgF/YER057c/UK114 family)